MGNKKNACGKLFLFLSFVFCFKRLRPAFSVLIISDESVLLLGGLLLGVVESTRSQLKAVPSVGDGVLAVLVILDHLRKLQKLSQFQTDKLTGPEVDKINQWIAMIFIRSGGDSEGHSEPSPTPVVRRSIERNGSVESIETIGSVEQLDFLTKKQQTTTQTKTNNNNNNNTNNNNNKKQERKNTNNTTNTHNEETGVANSLCRLQPRSTEIHAVFRMIVDPLTP